VLDVEVTPNRPDLLSHLGMARELSALTGIPLRGPDRHDAPAPATGGGGVEVLDAEGCPLYSLRRISGVQVAESPAWLRRKLESVGLRPINNVVDITNYVLLDTGQPLHAFDAGQVSGAVTVRPARSGEQFLALDGARYQLAPEDLVIADSRGAIALAGVMGGGGSAVTGATAEILLESAWFAPARVRATSRRHNLSSDSSYRFERGIDPAQVLGASALATRLVLEIAGGEAASGPDVAGGPPAPPRPVPLAPSQVERLLGAPVPEPEIRSVLARLGMTAGPGGWTPPCYRLDLARPVDLIEEVARVRGLGSVPSRVAASPPAPPSEADAFYDFALDLRTLLVASGFYEIQTIKLVSEGQLALRLGAGGGEPLRLKNPISDDHTALRPGLLPGLLAAAERNVRMGQRTLRLFEVGTVFAAGDPAARRGEEQTHLGLLAAGPARPASWATATEPPRDLDLYDLTGLLASFVPGLTVRPAPARDAGPEARPGFLVEAELLAGGTPVGQLAQLAPAAARALGLGETPVLVAELDLVPVARGASRARRFSELPKFPAVTRDVALEVPSALPCSDLAAFFAGAGEPLLTSAEVFDVFTDPAGSKLAPGRKSLAFTLTYRHPGRTLTSDEVDAAHGRVLESLRTAFPAQVR
jgi:phenylalanyl-tRNA synthetase beta chain